MAVRRWRRNGDVSPNTPRRVSRYDTLGATHTERHIVCTEIVLDRLSQIPVERAHCGYKTRATCSTDFPRVRDRRLSGDQQSVSCGFAGAGWYARLVWSYPLIGYDLIVYWRRNPNDPHLGAT